MRILSDESPFVIAQEVLWRLKKRRDIARFRSIMKQGPPKLRLRPIPYYGPNPHQVEDRERDAIIRLANGVVDGLFPFLSYGNVRLGEFPNWQADFVSGKEWPKLPSEQLPVVRNDGSDIKVPWELSRLQFLPILGKAYRLTGTECYRDRGLQLIDNWMVDNPVGLGVNWMVSMEVAFRALNILFFLNLLRPIAFNEQERLNAILRCLWQHRIFIETHLEYSHVVRGNHYLSNLIGLYGLGVFLEGPGMESCRTKNCSLLEREILHHVYEDGGNYEASTGYHVLVLQIFLTAFLLMKAEGHLPKSTFEHRLKKMFEWAATLADHEGRLPHIGDCDDGRVELFSDDLFQMASVPLMERDSLRVRGFLGMGQELFGVEGEKTKTDKVWYGLNCSAESHFSSESAPDKQAKCRLLPDSGLATLRWKDAEILLAALPNGIHGKGTHTHNDKLSILLRLAGRELLCDPGTGCYTRDLQMRNRFRSTRAHNCAVIDGLEQNTIPASGPAFFSLGDEARVGTVVCQALSCGGMIQASQKKDRLRDVAHVRQVIWENPESVRLVDSFTGMGMHTIDLCFNLGPGWRIVSLSAAGTTAECSIEGSQAVKLLIQAKEEVRLSQEHAEVSWLYGTVAKTSRVVATIRTNLPDSIQTEISWTDGI